MLHSHPKGPDIHMLSKDIHSLKITWGFCLIGRIISSRLLEKSQERPKAVLGAKTDQGPKTDSDWCEAGRCFASWQGLFGTSLLK